MGGPAGHAFLKRTQERQMEVLSEQASVKRLTEHFAERIGEVGTAEALVADRQLREVALGAFGLSEDVDNRFYIERILREGTGEGSLSSRLSDKRYARMAEAFGFDRTGEVELRTMLLVHPPATREEVIADREGRLEDRLTLVLKRELREIATRTGTREVETGALDAEGEPVTRTLERGLTEDERWSAILLDVGLRDAFRTALGLGEAFEDLPEAEQVATIRAAAAAEFGDDTASRFRDPEAAEALAARVIAEVGPPTRAEGFAERIVALYEARGFEAAVGRVDPSLRLALNLERELTDLAGRDVSERTKWFTVMGTPPLRQVFETAFGLPTSFGTLDVERQLETFQEKAEAAFGSSELGRFADPEMRDDLTRLYLARAQIAGGLAGAATPAGTALALLTGGV